MFEPKIQEATQESYYTTESNSHYLVDPNYQTISPPVAGPQQPAESNLAYMEHPSNHAIPRSATPEPDLPSYSCPQQWPELPTGNIPPMNTTTHNIGDPNSSEASLQEWARITAYRITNDPAVREEMLRGLELKRPRTPDPDLGAEPSQWMANSEDRDGADPQPRRTKRRKTAVEEGETGDRPAAQRGETQEPRVWGTPAIANDISKLGAKDSRARPMWYHHREFTIHSRRGRPSRRQLRAQLS
ncbi:hypothetical protein BJV77DRAFT_1068610 [Russula vinacea]|nr:hypothetical protein BJV77DRAFT_1068610 [Russula vinacea]